MAKEIEFDSTFRRNSIRYSPSEDGYHIVPIYGSNKRDIEKEKWINENFIGKWTNFPFGSPTNGRSYCFEEEIEATAFKLRWT